MGKANANAVALGKLRWKGRTDEEKAAHAKLMLAARWGKKKTGDKDVERSRT